MVKFLLIVLIIAHMVLVLATVTSFFILPFYAPWYEALPIMSFIMFFSTNRLTCVLTNLENEMRRKVGWHRIGGFVGHYVLKPVKKVLTRR